MTAPPTPIARVLALEPLDTHRFRGTSDPGSDDTTWGGQLVAQALMATALTVPEERRTRSLQSRFVRRASRSTPLDYTVLDEQDGRSNSFRRVVATQGERTVFELSATFQLEREGPAHQDQQPAVAGPEELPDVHADPRWSDEWKTVYATDWPTIDWRTVPAPAASRDAGSRSQSWLRVTEPVGDGERTHVCGLAYVSDLPIMCAVLEPHGLAFDTPDLRLASIDHAVWFHRPARIDDWLLFDQLSPAAGAGRALAWSKVFSRSGELVASIAQDGVLF